MTVDRDTMTAYSRDFLESRRGDSNPRPHHYEGTQALPDHGDLQGSNRAPHSPETGGDGVGCAHPVPTDTDARTTSFPTCWLISHCCLEPVTRVCTEGETDHFICFKCDQAAVPLEQA